MRASFIAIGIVLLGSQSLAAQVPLNTAYSMCGHWSGDGPTCVADGQYPLVWFCGDVVLVGVEEPTLIRFGRTARRASPRILAVVRSWTGHYFVFAGEELFKLIVEKTPDGTR